MNWDIDLRFIKKHSNEIANVSDIIVVPGIYNVLNPKYSQIMYDNQVEEWVLYGRHGAYDIPGESWADLDLRLLKELIDVHPELVGLLKISDDSGEMVDYIPENLFKFDEDFIKNNLETWISLEDYLPFDISKYESLDFPEDEWRTAQYDRELEIGWEEFPIYKNMDNLIKEKCLHYEDRVKAFNSVVIEWIDCYPEFEEIIAKESFNDYQQMKNNNEYIEFIDLLYSVKLPSEKKNHSNKKKFDSKKWIHKDDSSIRLPDFKKIDEIYDKYGASLLACYLAYLV